MKLDGAPPPEEHVMRDARKVKGKTYNWLTEFLIGRQNGNMLLLPCNQVGII